MGASKLYNLLEEITRETTLDDYRGQTLGIDASIWLYQAHQHVLKQEAAIEAKKLKKISTGKSEKKSRGQKEEDNKAETQENEQISEIIVNSSERTNKENKNQSKEVTTNNEDAYFCRNLNDINDRLSDDNIQKIKFGDTNGLISESIRKVSHDAIENTSERINEVCNKLSEELHETSTSIQVNDETIIDEGDEMTSKVDGECDNSSERKYQLRNERDLSDQLRDNDNAGLNQSAVLSDGNDSFNSAGSVEDSDLTKEKEKHKEKKLEEHELVGEDVQASLDENNQNQPSEPKITKDAIEIDADSANREKIVQYILRKIEVLKSHKVTPYFVFDGNAPQTKYYVLNARVSKKLKASKKKERAKQEEKLNLSAKDAASKEHEILLKKRKEAAEVLKKLEQSLKSGQLEGSTDVMDAKEPEKLKKLVGKQKKLVEKHQLEVKKANQDITQKLKQLAKSKQSVTKHSMNSVRIHKKVYKALKIKLDELQIKYIHAPCEADAQLVYLEKIGECQGVISDDADLLVFGCSKLIKADRCNGKLTEIKRADFSKVKRLAHLSIKQLQHATILSTSDYSPSVISLIESLDKIGRFKDYERVLVELEKEGEIKVPENYRDVCFKASLTYQYHIVFDPITVDARPLNDYPKGFNVSNDLLEYSCGKGSITKESVLKAIYKANTTDSDLDNALSLLSVNESTSNEKFEKMTSSQSTRIEGNTHREDGLDQQILVNSNLNHPQKVRGQFVVNATKPVKKIKEKASSTKETTRIFKEWMVHHLEADFSVQKRVEFLQSMNSVATKFNTSSWLSTMLRSFRLAHGVILTQPLIAELERFDDNDKFICWYLEIITNPAELLKQIVYEFTKLLNMKADTKISLMNSFKEFSELYYLSFYSMEYLLEIATSKIGVWNVSHEFVTSLHQIYNSGHNTRLEFVSEVLKQWNEISSRIKFKSTISNRLDKLKAKAEAKVLDLKQNKDTKKTEVESKAVKRNKELKKLEAKVKTKEVPVHKSDQELKKSKAKAKKKAKSPVQLNGEPLKLGVNSKERQVLKLDKKKQKLEKKKAKALPKEIKIQCQITL